MYGVVRAEKGRRSVRIFSTREELTRPARQNFSTNRPRRRCLCDEDGLVALGLAARAKGHKFESCRSRHFSKT